MLLDLGEEAPFPSGSWVTCTNEETHISYLRVARSVALFLPLCDAHAALWSDAIGMERLSLELP